MRKYFFLILLAFFPHCGRQTPASSSVASKENKLSIDYYKMSLLELEEGGPCRRSYRRALHHVNRALSFKTAPIYLAHKATLLFLLGSCEQSRVCFDQILSLSGCATSMEPNVRAEVLNNYACLLAKGGQKVEARRLFARLENDNNYLTPEVALVNQAKLYCDEGLWERAKEKLLCATKIAPAYVDAFYYLGLVCYALQDRQACLEAVEQLIALEPDHEGGRALQARLSF